MSIDDKVRYRQPHSIRAPEFFRQNKALEQRYVEKEHGREKYEAGIKYKERENKWTR